MEDENEKFYEEALQSIKNSSSFDLRLTILYIRNQIRHFPDKRQKTLEVLLSIIVDEYHNFIIQEMIETVITILAQARDKSLYNLILPYLFCENIVVQARLIRFFGDLKIREAVPHLSLLLPEQRSDIQAAILRALRQIATPDAQYAIYEWQKRGKV